MAKAEKGHGNEVNERTPLVLER